MNPDSASGGLLMITIQANEGKEEGTDRNSRGSGEEGLCANTNKCTEDQKDWPETSVHRREPSLSGVGDREEALSTECPKLHSHWP